MTLIVGSHGLCFVCYSPPVSGASTDGEMCEMCLFYSDRLSERSLQTVLIMLLWYID